MQTTQVGREPSLNFGTIIAPTDTNTFFETYWERAPLCVHGKNPDRFTGLFSRSDIDRVLANYGHADTMSIRLAKYENGRTEIIDVASDKSGVDPNRIFAAYCDGFTVNLNDINERHTPVRELAISLSDTLGCMVNVNAYLTPDKARAFPLHFDNHDVLIVQIEGAKSWNVYTPRFPLPTKTHKPPHEFLKDLPGGPLANFELQAGDVLYVPRGFGHEASTQDAVSLHLTIALHPFTYFDLIQQALDVVGWDLEILRRSIRGGTSVDAKAGETVRRNLTQLRGILAEKLPLEEAYELLVARALAARPASSSNSFAAADLNAIRDLHPESRIGRRPGTACKVVEGCGWISIHYPSHVVNFPPPMWQALEFIAQSEEFTISSLPGYITDDEKLTLVRRLITEGLLQPVFDQR